MDLIKFEFFCTAKGSMDKMERQSTEREKIFANDMIDKEVNIEYIQTAHITQHWKNTHTHTHKTKEPD